MTKDTRREGAPGHNQAEAALQLRTVRPQSVPPRAILALINPILGALLRSPLHRIVSWSLLLLTFTGRRTGKRFHIPLGYRRDGAIVTLIAGNPWWVNIRDGAPVTLRLAGAELHGIATPVEDRNEAELALMAFVERLPHLARMYDATLTPEGHPDPTSVHAATLTQVVVRVALQTQHPVA